MSRVINFPLIEYRAIVEDLSSEIKAAIDKAQDRGITAGDLVATIHGYDIMLTNQMLNNSDRED